MNIEPGYEKLAEVLQEALDQAQSGKGKERHANNEPFEEQQICQGARKHGLGAMSYQVEKKISEARRMYETDADIGYNVAKSNILGAINYAAAMLIVIEEHEETSLDDSYSPPPFKRRRGKIYLDGQEEISPTPNPDNVPNDLTPSDCPTFYDRLNFWRNEQYQKLGINCNDQKD